MHHLTFLQDLAVVMIVAAFVTVLFHRLKQPVVLGYILAGVIIGPHTLPFPLIGEEETIRTLSELGVIFLMFSLGLEFSLRKLKAVGATALVAATLEILVMIWAGFELGRFFGWGTMDSVFLGAILAISSTTIIIKALEELGKTKERFAQLIVGILIVEDILAILMLALLSGFAVTGSLQPLEVGRTVAQLAAFLAVLLVAGLIAVPRLLNYVAKFKSNEMLVVMVVGLCFGVSLLAAKLGYSIALGAFLIGAVIAEARQIGRIEALMLPVRDLFSAVFFVSIGLLIDPAVLWRYKVPILVITLVVVVGKVLACSLGAFVGGNGRRDSLRIGMGLAQIGEFSFIIASLGLTLKVTSDFLYPIAVAVSILTTLITPYLMRSSDAVVEWLERRSPAPLLNYLDAYTRWTSRRAAIKGSFGAVLLRRMFVQMALNVVLVAAIFIAAAALRSRALAWWPEVPGGENGLKALLWLGAMLASLPMLIAVSRKLQASAMLIGEMSSPPTAAGSEGSTMRAVVASALTILGGIVLALCVLLLSSALLPSGNVLLVLLLILLALVILLRRTFVRIHARAQGALAETFAQPPATPAPAEEVRTLPPLLRAAELRTVPIARGSAAIGQLISELRLRSETGASIVGIERGEQKLINPGPDEELQVDDLVLLLGSGAQLDAATSLLCGRRPAEGQA